MLQPPLFLPRRMNNRHFDFGSTEGASGFSFSLPVHCEYKLSGDKDRRRGEELIFAFTSPHQLFRAYFFHSKFI